MKDASTNSVVPQLRELLRLSNLTQRDLARGLGVRPSHLNLYFTEKSDMHSHKLIDMLDMLGIDVRAQLAERIAELKKEPAKAVSAHLLMKLEGIRDFNRESLARIIQMLAV